MTDAPDGILDLDDLRALAADGRIDNVVVAVPDLPGRLQGSRVAVDHFLDRVLVDGFGACTYLLASDVEMQTRTDYAFSPWDTGFGDLVLRPDLATLRRLPWDPRTALVVGDAEWPDGTPVEVAPRQVLRRQVERLQALGLEAMVATELEFRVFLEPSAAAGGVGHRVLTPATAFNVDYALAGLGPLDQLGAALRDTMARLGMPFETARGECAPGQYEITFPYGAALSVADGHVLYKTAAKAVSAAHGVSLTFMAKYDEAEGNSSHVHFSLRTPEGEPLFPAGHERGDPGRGTAGDEHGLSPLMARFLAGQLACLPELMLLFAPTINAYKRLHPGSFAPTGLAWGHDNRTCPLRIVGRGGSMRFEHRVPGADANPYLVLAGVIAAGLHGLEHELELPPETTGNAFTQDLPPVPRTLDEALSSWTGSTMARDAFGDQVVRHIAAAGRAERDSFLTVVTDWERRRGFDRT
jgi:glutamine synthetase